MNAVTGNSDGWVQYYLMWHTEIAQTPINSSQYARMILKITRRSCKHLVVEIFRKEMITCHEMWQSLQPHHCTVWQWRFYQICKTCKKWDMTLSSWMAMNSVMHDRHDARMVPIERRWVALYFNICHMQIFKLIDIKTMGLWKWITFILIRTV